MSDLIDAGNNIMISAAAPKTAPKKTIPAKAAPKKASAKAAKPKTERAPRAAKTGLRDAQIRILKVMAKARAPLTRVTLNEAVAAVGDFPTAEKFIQWMADPLGASDPANRPTAEGRCGYPSLLTLKYVSQKTIKILDKPTLVYEITATGRKGLEATLKAKAAK